MLMLFRERTTNEKCRKRLPASGFDLQLAALVTGGPEGPPCRLVNARTPHRLRAAPVLVEDRPQGLVEVLTVAQERLSQDAFLNRADLSQRTVSAPVRDGSTRLEAMRADRVEREVDHHASAVEERARAPEC